MFKFFAYSLGGFALAFMGTTFHYQAVASDQLTEILELKEKMCATKHIPPMKPIPIEKPTLSVQNRNPLNIKALGKGRKWEGQIGTDKFGHARFASWEYGVRAGAFVLKNYAKNHGINTVRGIIERFAEGNREEYITFVCKRLGVKDNQKIDIVKRLPDLLRAMARFESGERLPEHLFVAYDVMEWL